MPVALALLSEGSKAVQISCRNYRSGSAAQLPN